MEDSTNLTTYPNIQLKKSTLGKYSWFLVTTSCEFTTMLQPKAIMPAGHVTDFASVPRLLWPILPPHGRMANAAIVHDYCYDCRLGEQEHGAFLARLVADLEFAKNCRRSGVSKLQAAMVFMVVRMFGKKWWDQ